MRKINRIIRITNWKYFLCGGCASVSEPTKWLPELSVPEFSIWLSSLDLTLPSWFLHLSVPERWETAAKAEHLIKPWSCSKPTNMWINSCFGMAGNNTYTLIGSMYGIYIYTYIYHKNPPNGRWIYQSHGSYGICKDVFCFSFEGVNCVGETHHLGNLRKWTHHSGNWFFQRKI